MAVVGLPALLALWLGDGRTSGTVGLIGGVTAAPGLLVAGAPFADDGRYLLAVLGSVPLWIVLGAVASRRATATVLASWRDYARELLWLTGGVAVGAVGALVVASQILGEAVLL